jgi:predicted dienelactone hydrolase
MYRFLLLVVFFHPLFGMSRLQTPKPIGVQTLVYRDEARNRPVLVELWYPLSAPFSVEERESVWVHPKEARNAPIGGGECPLILFTHGHMGDRRDRSWLAEILVHAGFIVASVEHYGNTWKTLNPLLTLRYWDRPKDVSFALDQLLRDPALAPHIDKEKIGLVGYSLGGLTALALGGAVSDRLEEVLESQQGSIEILTPELLASLDFSEAKRSYRDPRIKALLLLAPCAWSFSPEALRKVEVPIALVATLGDPILPHAEHAEPILEHTAPVRFKLLRKQVGHQVFVNRVSARGKGVLHPYYYTDADGVDRGQIHRETGALAVDFFKKL